jgi:TIR domain
MGKKSSLPFKVFYCYAHEDHALRDELDKHLAGLRRSGLITVWHDGEISPGTPWKQAIEGHLESADIILLLVSADFIHSDYCYSKEMNRALERHYAKEARVVPILLRPVDWADTPFSELQALPTNDHPITSWSNRDEAFKEIVKGIRFAIRDLRSQQFSSVDAYKELLFINREEVMQGVSEHPVPSQRIEDERTSKEVSLSLQNTTLVIILGAGEYPYAPFEASPSFAKSAQALKQYFLDIFKLPQRNLLDLFDSGVSPDDLQREITRFLKIRIKQMRNVNKSITDVIIYFAGFGGLTQDNDVYLALPYTQEPSSRFSKLLMPLFADTINENARQIRKSFILDCWVVEKTMADQSEAGKNIIRVIETDPFKKLDQEQEIPQRGTSYLCSLNNNQMSIVSSDGVYTAFSEALLYILNSGDLNSRDDLSMHDLVRLVRRFLGKKYGEEASYLIACSSDPSGEDGATFSLFPNQGKQQVPRKAETSQENTESALTLTSATTYQQQIFSKMKYYLYISDTKLHMLYGQIPRNILEELASELNIGPLLLFDTMNATVSREQSEDAYYTKLKLVTTFIEKYGNTGSIDVPQTFFKGTLLMRWEPVINVNGTSSPIPTNIALFRGHTQHTFLWLGGSLEHIIGGDTGNTTLRLGSNHSILERAIQENYIFPSDKRTNEGKKTRNILWHIQMQETGGQWREAPPPQKVEFLAKTLSHGPTIMPNFISTDFQDAGRSISHILLGTPIYVALLD